MTAYGSMDLAVEAMSKGAYDYLPKPFGAHEVLLTLRKAEERESLRKEVGRLRAEVRADRRFGEIIARSPARRLRGVNSPSFNVSSAVWPSSTCASS